MIPIGLVVAPPPPDVANAVDAVVERARVCAAAGVDSIWLGQVFDLDALVALAVIGREVPGIGLGTAIATTYPRHPIAMSSQAQTVAAAVGAGRLRLGVGTSHRELIEDSYGYDFDRPVRHLREYLTALRALLHDGAAHVQGETLRAETFDWQVHVPGSPPPPVYVAALGPAMLRTAGELSDGTITWLAGPRTIEEHVAPLIDAAYRAAHPGMDGGPAVIASLPVCVTDDPDDARTRAADDLAMYDQFEAYRTVLRREGATRAVDVAIIGDERHVRRRLLDLADAGATELLLNPWNFTTEHEQRRTLALLGEMSA